jgi:peptidoglycan/LPS O-acetylase OafA/YrhL
MESGGFCLRDFYQRRIRRLFPALYAVLAFTLIAGLLILPPKLLSELVYSQFFTTLFLSNFAFAHLADYFDSASSLKPLLHTWSLGVEEQFYLIFPLALLALHRFAGRCLWPVLGVVAVVSLVLAQTTSKPEAAFYLPAMRAFELLIGALCVWGQARLSLSGALRRWLSLLGLALIIASLILLNDSLLFPGLWALPPCLGAALLLLTHDGWGNKLIAAPPLVFTGDISYSLYLWHWPLLVYARLLFGDSVWIALPVVGLAFVMAALSRRYIEQPFLDRRVPFLWPMALGVMAVSIISALLIFDAKGLPQRFNATEQAAFAATDDYNHDRRHCHLARDTRIAYRDACVYGDAKIAPSIAIWGDSEGAELAQALGERLNDASVRQITASACPPSVGYVIAYNRACRAHNADTLLHLKADPNIRTVVLVLNYRRYDEDNAAAMLSGLQLSALDLQSAGKRVVLVYPLPVYGFDPPSQVGLAMRLGRDPAGVGMSRAQFEAENGRTLAALDAFTQAHGLEVLRPSDMLCDAERCLVYQPKTGVLYFNGQHLSLKGAGLLADRLTSSALLPRAE